MTPLSELRHSANTLAAAVRDLLDEPTNMQALALARLIRERPDGAPFPRVTFGDGTWDADFEGGPVFSISRDGSVTS